MEKEFEFTDWDTGEKRKIKESEYFTRLKLHGEESGYTCLGKVEYENMHPVNEGMFGSEDFLWYIDRPDGNYYSYCIGANPLIGNTTNFAHTDKHPDITPKQFLTMLISVIEDHGGGCIRNVIDKHPRIRLEGGEWYETNMDYYKCKIALNEI